MEDEARKEEEKEIIKRMIRNLKARDILNEKRK